MRNYQDYLCLVNDANAASRAYYVDSAPTMTDEAFDGLLLQIEETEREHPEWTAPDSPTLRVGSDLDKNGRRRVRHRTPMRSCQKAQTREELLKWMERTKAEAFDVECKLDGISCSLVYQDGRFVSAATRGDGNMGQNITAHARKMTNVPHRLDGGPLAEGRLEVRGEIVCPTNMLTMMSRKYADCRTAASAVCNTAEATDDCRHLVFLPWEAMGDADELKYSHSEAIDFLTAHTPFRTGYFRKRFDAADMEGILEAIDLFSERSVRDLYAWPMDGMVVKVDDKIAAADLGATAKHGKWNIAYKFAPPTVLTRCTGIEVRTAMSGKRTPVAYFEPVELLGRRLMKANLYSEQTMMELGIEVGSLIEVGLQNDVTAKVFRVVKTEEECRADAHAAFYHPDNGSMARKEAAHAETTSHEEDDGKEIQEGPLTPFRGIFADGNYTTTEEMAEEPACEAYDGEDEGEEHLEGHDDDNDDDIHALQPSQALSRRRRLLRTAGRWAMKTAKYALLIAIAVVVIPAFIGIATFSR